jgi:4-amino-4-deoxy-L-arabinose transferase-like glycosyltransferase
MAVGTVAQTIATGRRGQSSIPFRALFALLVLAGTGLCLVASRWGIGLYTDSVVYIGAARSLSNGLGFQYLSDIGDLEPITQYPPGYPALIAAFAWLGFDALDAARWVSIFFAIANSSLIAAIVHRATRSKGATIVAVLLSFTAFPLVYVNSQALSEPPFIFLTLVGFCCLARYLRAAHLPALYGFALCVGVSCLVRYVGIAFGLTGAAVILFHGQGSWRKCFAHATIFSAISALPLIIWVGRNYLQAGNAVNRTFGFHLPTLTDLLPSTDTVAHWFLPTALVDAAPWPARLFLLIVFLMIGRLAMNLTVGRSWLPRLMIYCVVGYGGFLFISFSFNDQPLYFDTRTMALPYAAILIVAVAGATQWLRVHRPEDKSWRWFGFDCVMIALFGLQLINGALWLAIGYSGGIGYASESWRRSELIRFAKDAPPTSAIVSNAPDFIYTLTARRAAMIPHRIHPWTRQPNPQYAQAIAAMGEQLKQPGAVFIYFTDEDRLWYLPSIQELEAKLPLDKFQTTADGALYRLNGAGVVASK